MYRFIDIYVHVRPTTRAYVTISMFGFRLLMQPPLDIIITIIHYYLYPFIPADHMRSASAILRHAFSGTNDLASLK